jgi:flagellar L-ring protein FlgH
MNTITTGHASAPSIARRAVAAAAGLLIGLAVSPALAANGNPSWTMASRLYGDHRAKNVGDVLTVVIVEESTASLDAQQTTDKSMSFDGSASFYHPRLDTKAIAWTNYSIPAFNAQAARTYGGKGSLENKGKLSGSIAVRVMEVLPNGNLLIEGKRSVVVRNETVQFILTGTVRTEDIDKDNAVKSTQVADASISYQTSGSIADSQKKGMVPALLDWINPF